MLFTAIWKVLILLIALTGTQFCEWKKIADEIARNGTWRLIQSNDGATDRQ